MAFRFSLQTLLKLRRSLEKQEERLLQSLNRELAMLRQGIESLGREELDARKERNRQLFGGLTGSDLRLVLVEENLRLQQRSRFQRHEQVLQTEQRQQQVAYWEARQKRDLLDNLRKRRVVAFQREQEKRYQQAVDEAYLLRRHCKSSF